MILGCLSFNDESLSFTISLAHLNSYYFEQLVYGTEVPRSKLGLGLRPGTGPECGTRMPKCELGLRLRIAYTASHLISLLCTALISYRSESRSLTNAWQRFFRTTKKGKPNISQDARQFFWEYHCRAYVPELEPSSKATNLVPRSHLNIHLEQITLDLITGHICLSWNQVPKPQP